MPASQPPTPGAFYAHCLGEKSQGDQLCHFCGGPCGRDHPHDDLPPTIGIKSRSFARRPADPWMCRGCWLWRKRQRVTANWFEGGQLDGTFAGNHSWLCFDQPWSGVSKVRDARDDQDKAVRVTRDPGAWAIRFGSFGLLYEFLLKPSARWFLALRADCKSWLTGKKDGSAYRVPDPGVTAPENLLHVAAVNSSSEPLTAGTEFKFTLNNVLHRYTPYELEQALRHGASGKEPGVRVLIELLGPHTLPPLPTDPDKPKVGHPYPDTAHRTLGRKLK